jgi:hypothetical protein
VRTCVDFDTGPRTSVQVYAALGEAAYATGTAWFDDLQFACSGDCTGDLQVSIAELIAAVSIALGGGGSCVAAFDIDGNAAIAVHELVLAVDNALRGCAGAVSPGRQTVAPHPGFSGG